MKRLFNLLSKISINPLTTFVVFISLFSGRFKPIALFMMISAIHEIGHVLMALILSVKVKKIEILPFGFFAEIEDIEQVSIIKEFLIIIAGPLTYFISDFILLFMLKHDQLSMLGYQQAKAINLTILLFNILPIYPLDGGRILGMILSFFLTIKKVYIIQAIISFITLIAVIIYNASNPQYLLIGYLLILQITNFINLHMRWIHFLLKRVESRRPIKIHQQLDLYRLYDNVISRDDMLLEEKDAIPYLLAAKRRKLF